MRYLLLLLLIGCTSSGVFTDPDGRQWKAQIRGNAKAEMKAKDISMKIERQPLIKIPSIEDLKFGIGGDD